ncbi:MAG TPA: hypothetical protein VGZ26_02375 [Pirellulales bacterium]|nr:hypothetical protein [Pirellulales bacterium]
MKKRSLETLDKQFRDGLWGTVEQHKFAALIEGLLSRQGTALPDIESLYERSWSLTGDCHRDPRP